MRKGFWAGMMFQFFIQQFSEDIVGKEKYLKMTEIGWVNSPWWLWVLLAAVTLLTEAFILFSEDLWCEKDGGKFQYSHAEGYHLANALAARVSEEKK